MIKLYRKLRQSYRTNIKMSRTDNSQKMINNVIVGNVAKEKTKSADGTEEIGL